MSFWDGLNLQYSKHLPRYTVWARDLPFHKKVPFLTGNKYASIHITGKTFKNYFFMKHSSKEYEFLYTLLDITFMQILNRFVEKNILLLFYMIFKCSEYHRNFTFSLVPRTCHLSIHKNQTALWGTDNNNHFLKGWPPEKA